MTKMKAQPLFAKEADLCTAFASIAEREGLWTCYAEWAGWDILAVRRSDGFQVGIEAKLKLNPTVLAQALDGDCSRHPAAEGPDCRAVLVPPDAGNTLDPVCAYIGITVLRLRRAWGDHFEINPGMPRERTFTPDEGWHEWMPTRRHALPDYVPDVVAGSAAPTQLTKWKIAAMKMAILLDERPVVRADFKHLGLDHRRWYAAGAGWLKVAPLGGGCIAGARLPDFKAQHPRNYEEIKADRLKWMPPLPPQPKFAEPC